MSLPEKSQVRLAGPADAEGIFKLLLQMHSEHGLFKLAPNKLWDVVILATTPGTSYMAGVVGPPENIEASIGLVAGQVYYSEEFHIGDMWNYVRPEYRATNNARNLIEFGKVLADKTQLAFLSGIVSAERTEAKVRLYQQWMGVALGSYFMYRPTK